MFGYAMYIALGATIVVALLLIYSLICLAHIFFKRKKIIECSSYRPSWNIWISILKLIEKNIRKKGNTNIDKGLFKKTIDTIMIIISSLSANLVSILVTCVAVCVILYMLSQVFNSITATWSLLFNSNSNCTCYVLCEGSNLDDNKSSYELLFSPQQYKEFTDAMILSSGEQTEFDSYKTGKLKNGFLKTHLNNNMVEIYRRHLRERGEKIRKDNVDRQHMTVDELKLDLIDLLSDYKTHGRNASCECGDTGESVVKRKCKGGKHWKKGWTWQSIKPGDEPEDDTEDDEDDEDDEDNTDRGNATGNFAIDLGDGKWYWYHQGGSCTCQYCGSWNQKKWGKPGSETNKLTQDGCGIYALAIAISNLKGAEITPEDVLSHVCTSTDPYFTTSPSYFTHSEGCSGRGMIRDKLVSHVASIYGVTAEPIQKNEQDVKDALDAGKYIYGRWHKYGPKAWYNGKGHFMVIRKYDKDGFYCFTSTNNGVKKGVEGSKQTMKTPSNFSDVLAHDDGGTWYALSVSGYTPGGGDDETPPDLTSQEVYDILAKDSRFKSKALALAAVYKEIEPVYGYNGAIGIMANVVNEGNLGLVQYGKVVPNWNGDNKDSPKSSGSKPLKIGSMANVAAMKKLYDLGSSNDIGFGIVQWTWFTYLPTLGNLYEKHCVDGFNDANLIKAEMEMLRGNASTHKSALLQPTPELATKRWLIEFEICDEMDAAIPVREQTARDLDSLLKGVKK